MNWDDLRYFFAVAEQGTLSGAATTLRVNHTTVARRLAALEVSHQTKLFNKTNAGYQLTAAGIALANTADPIKDAVGKAKLAIAAHETEMAGPLIVTAPTALVLYVLADIVASFSKEHPEIEVSLLSDDRLVSLPRREADIAIRASNAPGENLVGRKIATFSNALYAAQSLLDLHQASPLPWVSTAAEPARSFAGAKQISLEGVPRCIVSGKSEAMAMAEAGAGAAILPCRLGDASQKLIRVKGGNIVRGSDIWLLYHQDLKANLRVRAFADFTATAFKNQQNAFQGATRNFVKS